MPDNVSSMAALIQAYQHVAFKRSIKLYKCKNKDIQYTKLAYYLSSNRMLYSVFSLISWVYLVCIQLKCCSVLKNRSKKAVCE